MRLVHPGIFTTATLAMIAMAISAHAQDAPPAKPMTIVIHEAGPAWKSGEPPQAQDLNTHFAYVGEAFNQGRLIAYGTQTDAVRGYYLLKTADSEVVKSFIDQDPAVKSGVLRSAATVGWGVLINAFAANRKDERFFLMFYKPGANWVKGKMLAGQNIGAHLSYIADQTKKGIVVAGGPASAGDEGIYVIRAASREAADAFTAADPGVMSGTFKPEVIGWNVIAMQPLR
jgi:uncharacterized protein YciI